MEIKILHVLIFNLAIALVLLGSVLYLIFKMKIGRRLKKIKKELQYDDQPIPEEGILNQSLKHFRKKYIIGFSVLNAALLSFFLFWMIIFYFKIRMMP